MSNLKDDQPDYLRLISTARTHVLDQLLVLYALFGIVTLVVSFARVSVIGWQIVVVVQIFGVVLICILAIFRKKISYILKAGLLIAGFFVMGFFALWNLGLAGNGVAFLITVSLMAFFLGGRILGGVISAVEILMLILFTIAVSSGFVDHAETVKIFVGSSANWITSTVFFALMVITLIVIVDRFISLLDKILVEQDRQGRELLDAKLAADAANTAKSEFLSRMSHELRTPLNAILGFSEVMGFNREIGGKQRQQLDEISKAGHHLLALIDDILDLARIEAGELTISLEPIRLADVFEACRELISSMALNKSVSLNIHHELANGIVVFADNTRIKQALINFLTNAIKYNKVNGTVDVICQEKSSSVRISVIDTGAGIEPEMQKKVFSAFDRLGKENTQIEGTGVGLMITKNLVELMGGNIGFESTYGVGSTFWFELVTVISNGKKSQSQLELTQKQAVTLESNTSTVLYIEDNESNLALVSSIFELTNLKLLTAKNGIDGIRTANSSKPDMILLDINLPGMDGYAIFDELRMIDELQSVPIVAVSANAMKSDIDKGLDYGFTEYIVKPIDVQYLLSTLYRLTGDAE